MSRKSSLDAIFATRAPSPEKGDDAGVLGAPNKPEPAGDTKPLGAPNNAPSPRIRSGAIAAMGGALEHLASRAQVAERIENGSAVVELDPELIDGSFVADRVTDATDPTLSALADSIRESGQQVPILVRPHPSAPGRYQIAYGHRRKRAAEALGKPVRALVRDLTDAELVVAQGKENLDRRDLSYVERSFFALHLEDRGFPRETICAAMATDKADVSRYVSLARALPADVVTAIGPAPKAGRPRWQALVELLKNDRAGRLGALFGASEFRAKPTDERFIAVLDALAPKSTTKPAKARVWSDEQGRKLARVDENAERFNLSIDRKIEPDFGSYLLSRLPEILADFKAAQE